MGFAAIASSVELCGAPLVSNVLASQNEGVKTVAITYDLINSEGLASTVTVEATSNDEFWVALDEVTGDVGAGVAEGTDKSIVWDAGAEWPIELFPAVKIRVRADDGEPVGSGAVPDGFSFIPAATFTMGSPESERVIVRTSSEPVDPDDEVLHEVTLTRSFLMSQTEVTYGEWTAVREWALDNGYTDLPVGQNGFEGDESGTHPASLMSWFEAIKWMNAKSEMDGLTPCYTVDGEIYKLEELTPVCDFDSNGYRLPTEAEWEYACRAGSSDAFYTGEIIFPDSVPMDPSLDMAGWYEGNSTVNTHPVGDPQKQANDFGLSDMHGNVVEWCWDLYGSYPAGDIIDPTGDKSGDRRVNRGGAFAFWAATCRSAYRSHLLPDRTSNSIGFRLTRTVK